MRIRKALARLSLLLMAATASCGKEASGPTGPSPGRSFLEGTWSGTLTIERPGEPSSTGSDVDVPNGGRDEPAVLQSHDPIAAYLAADHHHGDQCDYAVESTARSHQHSGRVPVTQGMHRHVAERRQCRDPDDRCGLLRRRLLVAAELNVRRTRDVDQDGMNDDGVC
jgi:hypothetical protein